MAKIPNFLFIRNLLITTKHLIVLAGGGQHRP